jgi:hypothetical protein
MGIRDHPIARRSPWQNAYVERLIGSNIAESNFRHTQVAERQPTRESRRDALVGFVRKRAQSSGTVSDEDLRRPVLQNLHPSCSVRCGQSMD